MNMDIATLGTRLSSSKVNLSIKEQSKYQQGTPIETKEPEFVNIAQMLHEFKNKLAGFEIAGGYMSAVTFPEDSFLALCIHIQNTYKSVRVAEFQKLLSQLKVSIVDTMDVNWKKFGFNRKRSLNIETFKSCGFSDAEVRSEYILFLAKYFGWSIVLVDYAKLEREDFDGRASTGEGSQFLFKQGVDGHYSLFVGSETIQERIRQDLQDMACPLLDSKKPSHVKKLAKLLV